MILDHMVDDLAVDILVVDPFHLCSWHPLELHLYQVVHIHLWPDNLAEEVHVGLDNLPYHSRLLVDTLLWEGSLLCREVVRNLHVQVDPSYRAEAYYPIEVALLPWVPFLIDLPVCH